jgi:hypothetical protein
LKLNGHFLDHQKKAFSPAWKFVGRIDHKSIILDIFLSASETRNRIIGINNNIFIPLNAPELMISH